MSAFARASEATVLGDRFDPLLDSISTVGDSLYGNPGRYASLAAIDSLIAPSITACRHKIARPLVGQTGSLREPDGEFSLGLSISSTLECTAESGAVISMSSPSWNSIGKIGDGLTSKMDPLSVYGSSSGISSASYH